MQAAVTALQRDAQSDPTVNQMEVTLPIVNQIYAKRNAQPISQSELDDIQAFLRGNDHHGERRVQEACASQSEIFFSCLPDDQCDGCYS